MANVSLPTPVLVVGSGLLLLAGYLVGVVAGPEAPSRTTGEVASYERRTQMLCLTGEDVSDQEGADADGRLCGRWRQSAGAAVPSVGDSFRFVSVRTAQAPEGGSQAGGQVLIYGDVVD